MNRPAQRLFATRAPHRGSGSDQWSAPSHLFHEILPPKTDVAAAGL